MIASRGLGAEMNSAQTRRVIAAGTIGNVLEWFDFAIYGYFASAIGRQFFPHEDAVAQLLSAFGVFALRLSDAACRRCARRPYRR
jgi:hypothetical protein